jgi:hypothetical protein
MDCDLPDFFQPRFAVDGNIVKWTDKTWDSRGRDVRLALGYEVSDNAAHNEQMMAALKQAAWQSVWQMASRPGPQPRWNNSLGYALAKLARWFFETVTVV